MNASGLHGMQSKHFSANTKTGWKLVIRIRFRREIPPWFAEQSIAARLAPPGAKLENLHNIVFFDLETGGTEPHHPITQLGAVAIQNDSIVEAFEEKLQFDPTICDPLALEMTHYSPEAWKNAKPPEQVARLFARFLEPYKCLQKISQRSGKPYKVAKLAGYNAAQFDGPRLRDLFAAFNLFLPADLKIRDVMQLAIWHFDETPEPPPESFKLECLAEHLGHPFEGAHDALVDSIGTYRVADSILQYHKKEIICV